MSSAIKAGEETAQEVLRMAGEFTEDVKEGVREITRDAQDVSCRHFRYKL